MRSGNTVSVPTPVLEHGNADFMVQYGTGPQLGYAGQYQADSYPTDMPCYPCPSYADVAVSSDIIQPYVPLDYHSSYLHDSCSRNIIGANGKPKRKRVATIAQRRAANIRERRRMFNLNEAFDDLRKRVPTFAYEKRLSRIETLRLAIAYIAFMSELVKGKEPHEIRLTGIRAPGWTPSRPHEGHTYNVLFADDTATSSWTDGRPHEDDDTNSSSVST